MDLLCHSIAGASTGLAFGEPVLGAVIACTPDLVLGIKRRKKPNEAYNLTHSLFGVALIALILGFFINPFLAFFCLLSHIALDIRTHGKHWSPTLWYPFSKKRCFPSIEWEFFNESWCNGLKIVAIWSYIWLVISFIKGL